MPSKSAESETCVFVLVWAECKANGIMNYTPEVGDAVSYRGRLGYSLRLTPNFWMSGDKWGESHS